MIYNSAGEVELQEFCTTEALTAPSARVRGARNLIIRATAKLAPLPKMSNKKVWTDVLGKGRSTQVTERSTGIILYEAYRLNGVLHRSENEGPALTTYDQFGKKEYYYLKGQLHRDSGPAFQDEWNEAYYQNGQLHRDSKEGPARKDELTEEYYENDQLHRDPKEGPAFIERGDVSEYLEYCWEGELHRDPQDGPAKVFKSSGLTLVEYRVHGKPSRDPRVGPWLLVTESERS
ncbi:hypothetical protein NLM33_41755 [Bradyrhizobium sp. CCGUVB1N3]|uniref:hypothetical protein n=1 Tax=Bradyrhizobium sp. CCGUVB1N3 TaxID=2949629 RepID=UPI0020B25DA1|nr:hypothetical protein [Bradyrhizobium sp. CCGUVB1N3]MCP3476692.1 hypothetical protein [Bradyrhizobium sp. CCGUVB1N3]